MTMEELEIRYKKYNKRYDKFSNFLDVGMYGSIIAAIINLFIIQSISVGSTIMVIAIFGLISGQLSFLIWKKSMDKILCELERLSK